MDIVIHIKFIIFSKLGGRGQKHYCLPSDFWGNGFGPIVTDPMILICYYRRFCHGPDIACEALLAPLSIEVRIPRTRSDR